VKQPQDPQNSILLVAATGAVALVYLASLVLNLVGVHVSYLNEAIAAPAPSALGSICS
jgi:hypothetical protein